MARGQGHQARGDVVEVGELAGVQLHYKGEPTECPAILCGGREMRRVPWSPRALTSAAG